MVCRCGARVSLVLGPYNSNGDHRSSFVWLDVPSPSSVDKVGLCSQWALLGALGASATISRFDWRWTPRILVLELLGSSILLGAMNALDQGVVS